MSRISAIELLELLPKETLETLAQQTGVDYKVHKLKGKTMFSLLLYGLLQEERMSLRTLEDCFNSSKFKFFFGLDRNQTTRYNSLSERLSLMNVSYFATLYEKTHQLFSLYYKQEEALQYHIKRVDATMVCEQAGKLQEGMSVGRKKDGKKQVKIALSLTGIFPSSVELFTSQSALSDDVALPIELYKEIDKKRDNVVVFDRGVTARACYAHLQKEGIGFITRLKNGAQYQSHGQLDKVAGQTVENLSLICDEKISFKSQPNCYFRLIRAQNEHGKEILFLSNRFDLPLVQVIFLYRKRWDIEVFFRFLKQELNLSHLLSMNTNGIEIILYMTLILAMLLLVYKKKNQLGYKTAKRRFTLELDNYITALIVEDCGGDSSLWMELPYLNQRSGPTSEHP